mmetsp:Transcript_47723/g.133058  ORF Transcript_47723/g.133058 Transcript_47723/m.133058 type:complete len:232 (+) Transcript_47723:441-1136(+)
MLRAGFGIHGTLAALGRQPSDLSVLRFDLDAGDGICLRRFRTLHDHKELARLDFPDRVGLLDVLTVRHHDAAEHPVDLVAALLFRCHVTCCPVGDRLGLQSHRRSLPLDRTLDHFEKFVGLDLADPRRVFLDLLLQSYLGEGLVAGLRHLFQKSTPAGASDADPADCVVKQCSALDAAHARLGVEARALQNLEDLAHIGPTDGLRRLDIVDVGQTNGLHTDIIPLCNAQES